jgi:hypothetical protein
MRSTVWPFGGGDKDPVGFAVISERHYVGTDGRKSKEETSLARQFVLVVCPDIVPITDRPASMEEFHYYFQHGLPHLPDQMADSKFVDLSQSGDHLYLLIYSWETKPLTKGLHQIMSDEREHYISSRLSEVLQRLRDSAGKEGTPRKETAGFWKTY